MDNAAVIFPNSGLAPYDLFPSTSVEHHSPINRPRSQSSENSHQKDSKAVSFSSIPLNAVTAQHYVQIYNCPIKWEPSIIKWYSTFLICIIAYAVIGDGLGTAGVCFFFVTEANVPGIPQFHYPDSGSLSSSCCRY